MAAVRAWAFSQPSVERLSTLISAGRHATDAMAEVEDDPETGHHLVGRGGLPNSTGVLECDAAIMEGTAGRFCVVAALRGVGAPVHVALRVMDRSPHSLLVGEGATAFAREQGFTIEPNDSMLTTHSTTAYQECPPLEPHSNPQEGLETRLAVAYMLNTWQVTPKFSSFNNVFTLIGGSFRHIIYTATGDGDKIRCYCPSFHVVQLMKQGSSPSDACHAVLDDIIRRTAPDRCFEIGLIALNMKGEVGAASSVEFPYAFWNQDKVAVETCTTTLHIPTIVMEGGIDKFDTQLGFK